jgi:hypothetical protein
MRHLSPWASVELPTSPRIARPVLRQHGHAELKLRVLRDLLGVTRGADIEATPAIELKSRRSPSGHARRPSVRPAGTRSEYAVTRYKWPGMISTPTVEDGSVIRGWSPRAATSVAVAMLAVTILVAPVSAGGAQVILEPGTNGCTGVLPSNDGNTDMRLVGGSMYPGGTAVFEISYPVNAANVGKEFTILDCAYINGVAALKYTVSFVPSNQFFVLSLTLAVPVDAPVGGRYCNYVKTTGSPTASQGSQRKAGPACFVIRPPPGPTATTPGAPTSPSAPRTPTSGGATPPADQPILLPNTAMSAHALMRHGGPAPSPR